MRIGAGHAERLEERREQRAAADAEIAVRAAARLVFSEIAVTQRNFRHALNDQVWSPLFQVRVEAWTRHAPLLAPRLAGEDYDVVANAITRALDSAHGFELLASRTHETRVAGVKLDGADDLGDTVRDVERQLRDAMRLLYPLAYGEPWDEAAAERMLAPKPPGE